MTALDDLNLEVGPLDTAEAFLAAWSDPERHWYARRRRRALLAAGLTAASFEALHPRGRDGKFIEKWGVVRWFDKIWGWRQGYVREIDTDSGEITVVSSVSGEHKFNDPKMLISRPTPKARMNLPVGGSQGEGTGFKKVAGQGGSNPGGFYEVTNSDVVMPGDPAAIQSPDITREHTIQRPLKLIADGPVYNVGTNPDIPLTTYNTMGEDTVVVPRLDGTPNRYDVVTRVNGKWYQVPAHGSLTNSDGTPRTTLVVPAETVFGEVGSTRRATITNDPQGMITLVRKPDVTPDDLAALVQKSASPPAVEGDKFYIKTMNIPERARNEALANAFYENLGIAVPEVGIGQDGKTVSSKLIGEKVSFDPKNPAHVKAAQDGFVADAWLANWDAVGLTYDNMQVNPDGTVFRVDAGGALLYRAMGKPKGQMFGNDVGELDSLRNPKINAQAASVYGSISDAQLQEQGELLRSITPGRITELAEMYDLPDLAPTLIARRQSILDQLGIGPMPVPEVPEPVPQPTSVYNPVEAEIQPGEPPKVAVDNYVVAFENLQTDLLTSADLDDTTLMESIVYAKNGGLWVSTGPYKGYSNYGQMPVRNLVTGEQMDLSFFPGEEFLTGYTKDDEAALEDIADGFKAQRELAIAEIAAESLDYDSIADAMNSWDWKESKPVYPQPYDRGVYHLDHLYAASQSGELPEGSPMYNTDTGLAYEVTEITQDTVTLRESGQAATFTVTNEGLMNTGPWRVPVNDVMVAMINARLLPAAEEPEVNVAEKVAVAEIAVEEPSGTFADSDPFSEDYTPPAAQVALVQKIGTALASDAPQGEKSLATQEYESAMQAYNAGQPLPPTPTLDKLSGTPPFTQPDTEATVIEPPEVAEIEAQIVDAAQPEVSVPIDEDSPLLKALGPQEPLFTASMSNQAEDWQHLIGQNVVVMTEIHFNDPDTVGKMTDQNGLIQIESVDQSYNNVWIRGTKGDGTKVSVGIGPSMSNKKVIIPVAQEPAAGMPLTLKTDGTIWSGKRNVGNWYKPYDYITLPGAEDPALGSQYYNYRAVINADESITGKPVVVYGNKKSKMKSAVYGYTRPIAPPPTKPKKTAVQKTEAEIAKLKQEYAEKFTPQVHAQVTEAYTGKYVTAPVGQAPLADGSQPVVGQWVYSPKDSTWWQVVQTDPKLTGKVPGTNLRVRREVSPGVFKETFRGRSTMYAVESYGLIPTTFLSTNIVTTGDGKQVGPGMYVNGLGGAWQVAEVKGGKVKIKSLPAGEKTHWVEAANLTAPKWQTMEITVVEQKSEAELQALIDLEVAKTVSDKVAEMLAQDLATPTPKKKKAPVTYPGPGGKLVKQNPVYAENRLAKGLQVLADGYAPMVGQVLRHKDGTRYVVIEVGTEWKPSQKNSVQVIPEGSGNYWNGKWRALSTLVVDHEAMLTDKDGKPLPAIKEVQHPLPDGTDFPNGSFIWRVDQEKFSGYDDHGNPRYKTHSEYTVVAPDGQSYSLATGKVTWNSSKMFTMGTRVGMIDKDAGDQTLTVTVDDPALSYPTVVGFAVLNPDENPAAAMAGKTGIPKAKPVPSVPPTQAVIPGVGTVQVGDLVTVAGIDEPVEVVSIGSNDTIEVGGAGGPTVSVPKSAVQPVTNPMWVTAKDGTKIHVGQVVSYYGTPMTVTAVDPGSNDVKLETAEGENYGWANVANAQLTGISPSLPEPQVVNPQSVTLTDGTVLTVGDVIQINDQPGMTVLAINSNNTITAQFPEEVSGGGEFTGTFDLTANKIGSGQGKGSQPVPAPPTPVEQPTVIQPESTGVDLTGDLPPFEGIIGQELAHPPIKSSAQGAVPVFSPTYAGAPLHEKPSIAASTNVRSVMDAVSETIKITESNKSGDRDWPSVYALADRDAIDDMLVQTQVVRDGKGQDFVEVRFRLNNAAADNARSQLLVKGGGSEYGDWVKNPINPKDLVLGDQISVKVSSQNETQLKPNDIGFPNAVVAGGPTLVGKSADGKYDVYRVEVAFSNGASGVLELQDRLGPSINTFAWDENKIRATNGALSLNPTAKNDGWAVRYTSLHYDRAGGGQSMEWEKDGAKKLGQSPGENVGSGHVLEWSGDGASIRYASAGKNSMDGMTVIRVPADDPDAQAKISSAMERIGITPEQQKPPDADALTYLALNKVFKQFSPTYIRGQQTNATPDNPEAVLALIDKAVGPNMPGQRKATMADISIAVTPDGWAQVLVSEDVARAIVKTNGVKHYYHRFTEKSAEIANTMPMSGESTGLMASTERWSNGLFYFGMSSQSDHSHDSANRLFLRASKSNSHSSGGGTIMVLDAVTLHRMVDYYWQPGDRFGDRNSNNLNFLNMGSLAGGNEIMVKRRIDARLWGRVLVSAAKRDAIIAALHKRGVTHTPNGMLLEDFYVVGSVDNKDILPGDFGDEVAIPELAAATPAVTV